MSIVITIKPEVETELARQAAAYGIDLNTYALTLLEAAAHRGLVSTKLSHEQIERTVQDLAQFTHKIPTLPDEAFSRESLYLDHD